MDRTQSPRRRARTRTPDPASNGLVLALCVLSLIMPSSLALESDDIQSLLRSQWDTVDKHSGATWGIADATAAVGKIFKMALASDEQQKSEYSVTEFGRDQLPTWLSYDNETGVLSGVPGQGEAGHTVQLQASRLSPAPDRDTFAIRVVEDGDHADSAAPVPLRDQQTAQAAGGLKAIKCPQGSSVTMATVLVDTELSLLSGGQRVSLLGGLSGHLRMPAELPRLLPLGSRPLFDSSALVAGPGDVKQPSHAGVMVQWAVGCGNVLADHMPVLQRLESTSHDGSMAGAVGHGILGWHVTNNKPHAAPRRPKRQVNIRATATPQPGPPAPTQLPGISEGRPASQAPGGPSDGAPPSHQVPSMASPSFPDILPTSASSNHHHHHRTKTTGRHHHESKTQGRGQSPAVSHSKGVPMATPPMMSVTPTKVVDVTPSTMEPVVSHVTPSLGIEASPGLSRSHEVVQPSHPAATPSSGAPVEPTRPLPTRTYTMPTPASSDPVRPSTTEVFTPPTKEPPMLHSSTPSVTTTTTPTPTSTPSSPHEKPSSPTPEMPDVPETPLVPEDTFDYPPVLKNQIPRLEVKVGDFLDYQIPKHTFADREDGHTRHLKLMFLTVEGYNPTPLSWVRFDEKTQRLYGLPLDEHAGRQDYLMVALDSAGKIGRDAFEIYVRLRPVEQKINHEFVLTLDDEYGLFVRDVNKRMDLARKIARIYGDNDMSKMTVTRLEEGSVVFAWTNNSLPLEPCPEGAILELLAKFMTAEGQLNQSAIQALDPYKVTHFEFEPRGSCDDRLVQVTPSPPGGAAGGDPDGGAGGGDGGSERPDDVAREKTPEDDLITTVVPAVVIAAILLLAAIIACLLYRKQRKGKLSDEDQNTFINKGIPIIFQDELDEKPEPPTTPLIMPEERPPMPPPGYPGYPRSDPSTPRSDHKEPLLDSTEDEAEPHSPLYHPPPPMTGSLGSRGSGNGRPRANSAQRSPPPYVPP